MSSKRRIRRKQCGDKRRYEIQEEASRVLWTLRNKRSEATAYKCQWCGKFHIGHSKFDVGYLSRTDKLKEN